MDNFKRLKAEIIGMLELYDGDEFSRELIDEIINDIKTKDFGSIEDDKIITINKIMFGGN